MFRVVISPMATAAMAAQKAMTGTVYESKYLTVAPRIMMATLVVRMSGRLGTPEAVGLRLSD